MITVVSLPRHLPPHECHVVREIGFLGYAKGTIVLCDCGQHYLLVEGWVTGALEWKSITARRANRIMAKRVGMCESN